MLSPTASVDWSHYNDGYSLEQWQKNTGGQDTHSKQVVTNADGKYNAKHILSMAKAKLFAV